MIEQSTTEQDIIR